VEKIFLKPTPTEILVKGSLKEGHLDIFSYDDDSNDNKKKLGSLYIVGSIQQGEPPEDLIKQDSPDGSDFAYVTNLIASLAKREYYSNSDVSPKEAFSSTLKKINDVVGEFFINKNIKVNMGIFALAGENINISKIGKFKIFLARDNKTIDILNNIDLFTKEKVEEKEFSHVVSGKIGHEDKILAFYPSRLATAREKIMKENFLKLTADQFVEKIDAIKKDKSDFAYAGLYINLNRVQEPALMPKIVKTMPSSKIVPKLVSEKPVSEPDQVLMPEQAKHPTPHRQLEYVEPEEELPRIIRSEFSLGKKENPLAIVIGKIKMFIPKKQNKILFFTSIAVVVLTGAWTVKSFFIISPEQKQTTSALSEARDNAKLAKTKISQNDLLGARKLLLGSILNINSITSSDKTEKTKSELLDLLDGLDQAVETSPTLVEALPKSVSDKASLISIQKEKSGSTGLDIYEDNLYMITPEGISKITDISSTPKESVQWLKTGTLPPEPLLLAVDGKVYVLSKSGLLATFYKGEKQNETSTLTVPDVSSVLATTKDSQYLYFINKNLGRIYLLNKSDGSISKTIKVSSQEAFAEAYLDQDEAIYLVSKDGKIWKVQ